MFSKRRLLHGVFAHVNFEFAAENTRYSSFHHVPVAEIVPRFDSLPGVAESG